MMKKEKQNDLYSVLCVVIGQEVWVKPSKYHRGELEPRKATVSKIGRKYFELKEFPRCKYRLSDGIEENNTNYKGTVYLNLQDILDEKEHAKLSSDLRKIFSAYGLLPYSLETLRKVAELVDANNA